MAPRRPAPRRALASATRLLLIAAAAACASSPPRAAGAGAAAGPEAAARGGMAALEARLRQRIASFDGDVGIYLRHAPTGREIAIAADEVFPTASMVKVPLLVGLYAAAERGELRLDTLVAYHDSLFYESPSDLTNKLRPGEEVELATLALLMIVTSDNTASLWIQGLVGGAAVNRWLAEHGFEHTRVNSRVDGRRDDWQRYGWGQTTPREIARLMVMIGQGRAVSPGASAAMYRLLTRGDWPFGAAAAIPPGVQVASKYGAVDRMRGEVLLVRAAGGDYVLSIITNGQADTRWVADNAGNVLARDVSRLVHEALSGHARSP